ASSYGNTMESSRDVRILKDLDDDIKGKDVLLVEDIIDTGNTLNKIREILSLREPKSIAICTLLDKPSRREVNVPVDWIGFEIPDEFVVGVGID
ncbi:phosphoribosyltransferase family protein, partial [Escherichia coli]|nr:phosphoribosyltransferase family protein [Escherichia coli]